MVPTSSEFQKKKPAQAGIRSTLVGLVLNATLEAVKGVAGVPGTHKGRVRKVGFDYFVDLDVLCDPDATTRQGHDVAHDVGEAIHAAVPFMSKVLVRVEPADDYSRRSRER